MRTFPIVAAALLMLGTAAGAQAQSGQGGYLGQNPAAHLAPAPAMPPQLGSLQGGYLGKNPGRDITPAKPTSLEEYLKTPTAWCENSIVPSRCRNRAAADHAICLQRGPDGYASCRRTMDYMGWPT